jgi:hypothetical protein
MFFQYLTVLPVFDWHLQLRRLDLQPRWIEDTGEIGAPQIICIVVGQIGPGSTGFDRAPGIDETRGEAKCCNRPVHVGKKADEEWCSALKNRVVLLEPSTELPPDGSRFSVPLDAQDAS